MRVHTLRACEYLFCHRSSLFAAEVFYHTYISKCQGQAFLLFLLYTMNFTLLHISAVTITLSSSDTRSGLQVGKHKLFFTAARVESRLPANVSKKYNLVLCLQVVTTTCNFNALPRSLKGWRGRICGEGPKVLPNYYPPLWQSCRHPKKELESRQAKLLLFKSTVVQILKPAGDWLLNPENYTSVIPKTG